MRSPQVSRSGPAPQPGWVRWMRSARALAACLLLTTCSTDSAMAPGHVVESRLDVGFLFRAGGTVPIPVDAVLVELRRASDSSIVYSARLPSSQFAQQSDSLILTIQLELRTSPERFYFYAAAIGGGVTYYTVSGQVTAVANQTVSTPPLVPTYVGPGNTADSVRLTLSAAQVNPGDSVLATATVYDNNAIAPGVPVGIGTSDSSLVVPRASGLDDAWLVAQPGASGVVTVTAVTPTGLSFSVNLVLGAPTSGAATVTALSPTAVTGVVNQLVGQAPSVVVRDSSNLPLANVTVIFAAAAGNGTVTGGTQVTNASGVATVGGWRLAQPVGTNTLTATVSGLTPVTFTATSGPTAIAILAKDSGDAQSDTAGRTLPRQLVVQARDTFANVIPALTVNWTATDGSLTPVSGSTDAQGRARTSWTLGFLQASPTVTASAGAAQAIFTATTRFGQPTILLGFTSIPGVGIGLTSRVRVQLNQPAPAGGTLVTLTSGNPAFFTVTPLTVTIPQGSTTDSVTIFGQSAGTALLTASATGYTSGTLSVDVQNRNVSVPVTLNVPYGQTASLPIQLPAPAPAGGVTFTVTSSNPTVVGIQSSQVTIAAGQTAANAVVQGLLPGSATVTVSNPAYNAASSTVNSAASLNVLQGFISLDASFGTTIDIRFESSGFAIAAPAGGIAVTLTARNSACVIAPGVTIPAGQVITQAALTAGTATLPCTTYLVATAPNIAADSVQVAVNPTPGIGLTSAVTVGAGLQSGQSGNLATAGHGGVTVRIASSDPAVALVAPNATTPGTPFIDIAMPNGSSFFNYTVQAVEGQPGVATLTASAPGFTNGSSAITTVTPALDIIFLPTSTTSFSANSGFQVRTGVPNGQLTTMSVEQSVRAGGPGVTATVVNDSAAVAQLVTSAITGQSVTVPVSNGQARSPGSVATGGVEFDPLAPGVTTVRASISGYITLPTAAVNVSVAAPVITLGGVSNVGAGLQTGTSGNLGASNHGGVTVRITSSDPAKVLVAPNASTAGAAFVDLPLLNGNSFFSYTVQALEGQTGPVALIADAPGFVSDTVTVTVAAPAHDIIFLPTTMASLAPNAGFQVRTGLPNGQLTAMSIEQPLRAGSPGVTATITNRTAAVARLLTSTDTGQLVTVAIAAQQARSPGSLATGGVEYDPLNPGFDTVSATIPGFIAVNSATQAVTVTGQAVTMGGIQNIGSGLQVGSSGSLGASNHGGVTVRVESLDPSKVLIAPNVSTVGSAFLDIFIPNGSTFFSYTAQALEGQAGTVNVTATAPGFTPDTVTATVAPSAIDIIFLSTAQTTFSPNNAFQIRAGLPNAGNTAMASEQTVRPGGTPIVATINSSVLQVGALVSQAGSGQSATVTIGAGQSRSPGSVATGGVEFDPILGGQTTVSATAPQQVVLPTASVTVTVTSPIISLGGATVGDGLQVGTSGSLGASNHGGTTVRITSSDPAIALVAPNTTTPGTPFIDISIPNNSTFFSYVIQGVEGQAGVPAITATAPGFTDGNATATVVPAAADIIFLPTSTTLLAGSTAFQVRLGIPNANTTAMSSEQSLRAGGTGATATVSNSNSGVANLLFQGGPAQSGSVTFQAQQSRSPSGASNGGVEFSPTGVGSTGVSATVPGFITLPTATQTVSVSVPGITVSSVTVGSGLQAGSNGSLGASQHSGVTVRVTSANPSLFLVAQNATTAGTPFVDIPLANGNTFFSYVVQGVDGATGSAAITAIATGFTQGSATNTVVQPAADIIFLSSTISSTAANDPFQVRLGIPDALGNSIQSEQARASGLSALTATLNNATATAAQLVTSLGAGQSAQVSIISGAARSPGTVATGGVEFDPLASGSTSVSVNIPGYRIIPASTVAVTVQ